MKLVILDVQIKQDKEGRFSLNDLHMASGSEKKHQPSNWLRLDTTIALIHEIDRSSDVRNASINSIRGGKNQGTYVCKELVYAYAMWINAKFHLKVIRTFDDVVKKELEFKIDRDTARLEYSPMTDAVKFDREVRGKDIKPFHFSNEADLINRIALGMTSAKFKAFHEIDKKEAIRDYLTPCQLKCIADLQRANTTYILDQISFEDRKKKLTDRYRRLHLLALTNEVHGLSA